MEYSTNNLPVFEVANEGGGLLVGQEITTNIRLSRCDEIDALGLETFIAVGLDRRSQLPRAALNGYAADRWAISRRTKTERNRH